MTQRSVADRLGIQRAMISQWETGRHVPTDAMVDRLGELLGAGAELSAAAEEARLGSAPAALRPVEALMSGSTLYDVHRSLGRVLVERMVVGDDGRPLGWRRDFRDALPPSAFTTASAVRTLLAIQDPPSIDRHALGQQLLKFRLERGGWGTRMVGARPEATAVVIDALERLGADFDIDEALAHLATMVTGTDRHHTYVLVEALSTADRLRPDSTLVRELAAALVRNQSPSDQGWLEKRVPVEGAWSKSSTAHTARAITVLVHALDRGLDDPHQRFAEAVNGGRAWLERHADLASVRENVEPDGQSDLEIRHFTPALVAHALASVPAPPRRLLEQALKFVWDAYNGPLGLWQWWNGDVPVWLQLDALRAVTTAHARLTTVPVEVTR